jgi:transcription elongation factor Elf1
MPYDRAPKTSGHKRTRSPVSLPNSAHVNKRRKSGHGTDYIARESPSTPSPSYRQQQKISRTLSSGDGTNRQLLISTTTPLITVHRASSTPVLSASNETCTAAGRDTLIDPTTPNRNLQFSTSRYRKERNSSEDFISTPNGNSSRSSSPYTPFDIKKTFRCHVCGKSKQPYSFYRGELEGTVNCTICGHDLCAACPRYINGLVDEFVLVGSAFGQRREMAIN